MSKERLRECREALQRLDTRPPLDRLAVSNNLATIVAVLLDVVDDLLDDEHGQEHVCTAEDPCLDYENCPRCKDFPSGSGG